MYGFCFGEIIQCRLKRNILKSTVDLVANTREKTMKYLQFNITRFRWCSPSPMLCSTFTFSFFKRQDIFLSTDGNAKTCYISQKRSGIITLCQDICLDEPERIQNNCLIFSFYASKLLHVLYILEALRHNNIMSGFLPG